MLISLEEPAKIWPSQYLKPYKEDDKCGTNETSRSALLIKFSLSS